MKIKMACLGIGLFILGSNFSSVAVGPTCLANCTADCSASMNPQDCFNRFCSICYDQNEMTPSY